MNNYLDYTKPVNSSVEYLVFKEIEIQRLTNLFSLYGGVRDEECKSVKPSVKEFKELKNFIFSYSQEVGKEEEEEEEEEENATTQELGYQEAKMQMWFELQERIKNKKALP